MAWEWDAAEECERLRATVRLLKAQSEGFGMSKAKSMQQMTQQEFWLKGQKLFGRNMQDWKFVCPRCGYVASVSQWIEAGAPPGAVAFSCIGRWVGKNRDIFGQGPGPCDYAGGGLFKFNPQPVIDGQGKITNYFAFAVPNEETPVSREKRVAVQ